MEEVTDRLQPEITRTAGQLARRHPVFEAHERFIRDRLAELAYRAYQRGMDESLLSLTSSQQAAEDLGISVSQVQRYAKQYALGWQTGRDVVLRPDDVQFIRERIGTRRRPK